MNLKEIIKEEKKNYNTLRFVINYVLVPIFLLVIAAEMVIIYVTMSIDEEKFLALTIVLIALIGAEIIVMTALIPYFRRKETEIECARLDFSFNGSDNEDIIVDCHTGYYENETITFSESSLIFGYFEEDEIEPKSRCFDYADVTAEVLTSNKFLHVNIFLDLTLKSKESGISPLVSLDGKTLFALRKYAIKIVNEELLNYILNNKKEAFYQILKYGEVKKF